MRFLEQHRLFGRGLGWTDVHLLAAAALSHFPLWTMDQRLRDAGRRLRLAFGTMMAMCMRAVPSVQPPADRRTP